MAAAGGLHASGNVDENDNSLNESAKEDTVVPASQSNTVDIDTKFRAEAMWEQMNKGIFNKTIRSFSSKCSSNVNKPAPRASNNWMKYLQVKPPHIAGSPGQDMPEQALSNVENETNDDGKKVYTQSKQMEKDCEAVLGASNNWMKNLGFSLKKTDVLGKNEAQNGVTVQKNGISDEGKRLAAAALSAVRDAAAAAAGRGKVEVTEMREFAGQEIEVKRRLDTDAKEASEKAKGHAPSAVDAVLEQIKKKPKLSVLDKTKKDWGEFKEEKGLEEELDAYKKSSNQYLDKVSFLQRADYREFERERDARLSLQARRRTDMSED